MEKKQIDIQNLKKKCSKCLSMVSINDEVCPICKTPFKKEVRETNKLQKKCQHCLCMVDLNERVCPYCKTPFKDLKTDSITNKPFTPPPLLEKETKKDIFKTEKRITDIKKEEPIILQTPKEEIQKIVEEKPITHPIPTIKLKTQSPLMLKKLVKAPQKPIEDLMKVRIKNSLEKLNLEFPFVHKNRKEVFEIAELLEKEDSLEEKVSEINISVEKKENNKSQENKLDIQNLPTETDENFKNLEIPKLQTLDFGKIVDNLDLSTTELDIQAIDKKEIDDNSKNNKEQETIQKLESKPLEFEQVENLQTFDLSSFIKDNNISELETLDINTINEKPILEPRLEALKDSIPQSKSFDLSSIDKDEIKDLGKISFPQPIIKNDDEKEDKTFKFEISEKIKDNNQPIFEKPEKPEKPVKKQEIENVTNIENITSIKPLNINNVTKEDKALVRVSQRELFKLDDLEETSIKKEKPIKKEEIQEKDNINNQDIDKKEIDLNNQNIFLYESKLRGSVNFLAINFYKEAKDFYQKDKDKECIDQLIMALNADSGFEQAYMLLGKAYLKLRKRITKQ